MKRWWILVSCISVAVIIAMIAGLEFLARSKVDPIVETYIDQQNQYLAQYFEDQDFFKSVTPLAIALQPSVKKSDSHDAGNVLNSIVAWSPAREGSKFRATPWISPDVRDQIIRRKSDWIRHHSKYSALKISTDWISGLQKFTFWDLEKNSPIAEFAARGDFVAPFQLPLPDSIDLTTLTKLHLMRGASGATGVALKALADVRQLGQLMMSTENLHVILAGIALLDVERNAYRFYVEKGFIKEGDWQAVDRNTTRRAHRAIVASREYLRLWTPPEILEKVFLNSKQIPLALCASVNEALPSEFMLKPMLLGHLPLERDFSENYIQLAKVLRRGQASCRLTYLSKLIEQDNFRAELPVPWMLTYLPYSRKLFGLKMSTLGLMGFDGYK